MESSSGSSNHPPETEAAATELEGLQKQHEEKMLKIQELKKQIESAKLSLEERKKKKKMKDISEERKQSFNILCEKYNFLRDKYNSMLAENSKEESAILRVSNFESDQG